MMLRDFQCERCQIEFEQLRSRTEDDTPAVCPKCGKPDRTHRMISRFRVGGRGDLRESTFHGCHDHDLGSADQNHRASHDHDHEDD